mmetsp:Transcript_24419/g.29333  ORF Transcript_24419/g.29333 Transcript_24419/m.29333 type:complete len:260 (+) Transcript_24419:46-825(+)
MSKAKPSIVHEASAPLELVDSFQDEDDEDTKEHKRKERTFWTRLWQGLAGASAAVAVVAMAIEQSFIVVIAGVVALLVAPVVVYFQFQLQDTDTLRRIQNLLRQEVNRLQIENNELSNNIDELEQTVDRLGESEQQLEAVASQQEAQVSTLVKLVKENGEIQTEMKEILTAQAFHQIMSVIMDSDRDQSSSFSEPEVRILTLRLEQLPGISVHKEKFQEKVSQTDGSMAQVTQVVLQVYDDNIPEEEKIFEVDLDALHG